MCFHRLGRLRDRTLESRQRRASGLTMVVAIILWNTVCMERGIQEFRAAGDEVTEERLAESAPLSWQPINLTGDHLWTEPPRLDGEAVRPIGVPVELLVA